MLNDVANDEKTNELTNGESSETANTNESGSNETNSSSD